MHADACRFGLVYPGVGWLILRDRGCLPEDMVLMTSYLGRPEPTITMNFSRNAAQVAASYYNVRLQASPCCTACTLLSPGSTVLPLLVAPCTPACSMLHYGGLGVM